MELGPKVVFEIAGLPFTNTFLTGAVISLIIMIIGFIISLNIKLIPGRLQATAEILITTFYDYIEGMMPGRGRQYLPLVMTILLFVAFSNLAGVIPMVENPTGDINITVALAGMIFLIAHAGSIKSKGIVEYIKGYFSPIPFLFPLNIIGELAKPVSHSMRLFGNMVGGGIILTVIMTFIPWIIPVPLIFWFDVFAGVIQAFIFTMLTIVYIAVLK